MRPASLVLLLVLPVLFLSSVLAGEDETPLTLDRQVLQTIFSEREFLHFSISWSGGIKIGDLALEVRRQEDRHQILARVTDYGLFHLFYPVNDTFTTKVAGPLKLPQVYHVLQREGWGGETRRFTRYMQKQGVVIYRKNDQPEERFAIDGPVYNEFSSFFVTRALNLTREKTEIVPTFVDGKRHLVAVKVMGREELDTLFGPLRTIKVMPLMHFKGLYDKEGDTVFWLSDDQCRIPLRIESKILIGSLVADLLEYDNPACPLHATEDANRKSIGH